MKKIFPILVICLLTALNSVAGPSLKFSERVKKLGTIEQFKRFKWVIKVENVSDKPVSFTKIKTTCGCTLAKPEKQTIMPGKTINFTVIFNSEYFQGHIEKLVFIDTSTKERYTLRVIANVQKSIYIEPKRININGNEKYFEQLVEVKTFKNSRNIKIKKIFLPKEQGISYKKISNSSFVLKVEPTKIKSEGTKVGKVILEGNYKPLIFYINIKKPKFYSVSPTDNLLFLNVKSGKKYTKTVMIKSRKKFNILTKKSNIPFVKLKDVKRISDKEWKITIEFNPQKVFKTKFGKTMLILKTDNKTVGNINLPVIFNITK